MIKVISGAIIGFIIGSTLPLILLGTKITAIILIVSMDAAVEGMRAILESSFKDIEIISSFILNLLVTIFLLYLGDYLSINLYYIALFALGMRIFANLSKIRWHMVKKL